MANTIQVRRGANADLPALAAGEIGFSTDTHQAYIGNGGTNYEVVMHQLFDANTILAADSDNTPAALTVAEQTIVGRITAGNIDALTSAEVMALLSGGASADFAMNSNKITGVSDPTGAQDAATKAYVDAVAQGLSVHTSVACATTENITLEDEQTLDGVLTSADRVLVKDQTNASENGIYVSQVGAWSRAADMDAATEFAGGFVYVEGGTTLGSTGWVCTNEPEGIVVDTTNITFSQFSSAGYVTASGGLAKTGNDIAPTGVLEDLNTLGAASSDGEVIVATGAGAFAYESGATLLTSIGAASKALDNLSSVALNTALLPDSAAADDFGSATLPFKDLYFAGSSGTPASNNFKITGASTSGTRTITFPDSSGTVLNDSSTIDGGAFA